MLLSALLIHTGPKGTPGPITQHKHNKTGINSKAKIEMGKYCKYVNNPLLPPQLRGRADVNRKKHE